jgi:hypothetical protein
LTKYGDIGATFATYSEMAPDAWRLIPLLTPGEDGSSYCEVKCNDIPKMVDDKFFIALRFWKRYKRFSMPGDWRDWTVAQLKVLELFDTLHDDRAKR